MLYLFQIKGGSAMDIKKRLFRRPFTTVLWLALVIIMTVSLGVGMVLSYSTGKLIPLIDAAHTTIATRTDKGPQRVVLEDSVFYSVAPKYFSAEDYDFFIGLDSVKNIYFHSLTGGYIPELQTALGLNSMGDIVNEGNESYERVIFSAVVERVDEVEYDPEPVAYLTYFGLSDNEQERSFRLSLKIDEVIAAHPDHELDGTIKASYYVYGDDDVGYLEPGEKYLFTAHIGGGRIIKIGSQHNIVQNGMVMGYDFWIMQNNDGEQYLDRLISDPAIQKIEGSAAELIAQSPVWQDAVDRYSRAMSHFPVIGTDNIEAIYGFNSNDMSIVEGRAFEPDEYKSGARVCLISQTVAVKSGVKLGDTVHISQFLINEEDNRSLSTSHLDGMMNNPTVGDIMQEYDYITDGEEFTVVGIYRQTNQWEDTSYAFTPNTVFIPKEAQIEGGYGRLSEPVYREDINGYTNEESGVYGVLFSMELQNGMVEDFRLALAGTEWATEFTVFDQGYDGAMRSMQGTAESARSLMLFSLLGWLTVLLLYVLLYQGVQRRNVGIMRSLGAKPRQARNYLFWSGIGLASVGIAVGTAVTSVLTQYINTKLYDTVQAEGIGETVIAELMASSSMPIIWLIIFGVLQVVIFAVALYIHAGIMSRKSPRKLFGG